MSYISILCHCGVFQNIITHKQSVLNNKKKIELASTSKKSSWKEGLQLTSSNDEGYSEMAQDVTALAVKLNNLSLCPMTNVEEDGTNSCLQIAMAWQRKRKKCRRRKEREREMEEEGKEEKRDRYKEASTGRQRDRKRKDIEASTIIHTKININKAISITANLKEKNYMERPGK